MFFLAYMLSELRRRSGRTLLTALGLGVGVGLVVAVSALSTGLDDAQDKVLEPLTGVGTDMSVTRPLDVSPSDRATGRSGSSRTGSASSSARRTAAGASAFATSASRASVRARRPSSRRAQLCFARAKVNEVAAIDGVAAAAGGLTLNSHPHRGHRARAGGAARPVRRRPRRRRRPPDEHRRSRASASPASTRRSQALGAITPGQITTGRYFSRATRARRSST